MTNSVMVIQPYWHNGAWVFDEESLGLDKEPFVAGVPEMIDALVRDIPGARSGFKLLFSAAPFPGYQLELTRVRDEHGGTWYRASGQGNEGWLCPALLQFFESAPVSLFARAEPCQNEGQRGLSEVTALRNRVEELERLVYSLTLQNELFKIRDEPSPPAEYPPRQW